MIKRLCKVILFLPALAVFGFIQFPTLMVIWLITGDDVFGKYDPIPTILLDW